MTMCKFYDSAKKVCNNNKNPAGIGSESGVESGAYGRCNSKSEKCGLNGGKDTGKCCFYDSSKKVCNNKKNPAGIGSESGVESGPYGRCNSKSEKCGLNGGKSTGKCCFYDSSKKECNNPVNPAGIGTTSGVEKGPYGMCNSKSEKCIFNGKASNVNNGLICPFCKKQISQISKRNGRCEHCGKYF